MSYWQTIIVTVVLAAVLAYVVGLAEEWTRAKLRERKERRYER